MRYRQFGNTDLSVSEIGFGAWAIGGPASVGEVEIGWGPSDDAVSVKAIHAALDGGINFFDTADFYGLGHSELLLGKTIGKEKEALIATKVGQKQGKDGKIIIDYSFDYVIRACEESLRRLKREHIDFYQLHVARLPHLEEGGCIKAMQQLMKQGKVRYWGISLNTFAPLPEAGFILEHTDAHGMQLVLNMINQRAEPLLEQAAAKGLGIIARMPLQFGLLSGHIGADTVFDKSDHRSKRLTAAIVQKVNQLIKTDLNPLAKQYNTSLAGLALSYILFHKEVSTVIPGIRNERQARLNTQPPVQLSNYDHEYISSLFDEEKESLMQMIIAAG